MKIEQSLTPIHRMDSLAPGPQSSSGTRTPKDIAEAASQFEALLIGQMLKEVRASESGGWMDGGGGGHGSAVLEMAEEQLARTISAQGGLGLGQMIQKQFEPGAAASDPRFNAPGGTGLGRAQEARPNPSKGQEEPGIHIRT